MKQPAITVDIAVLKNLVGDDPETVRVFLLAYRASARRWIAELHAASAAVDGREVAAIAHKLKSAARAVGASVLGGICADLECACRAGDGADITSHVARIAATLASVESEIGDLLGAT